MSTVIDHIYFQNERSVVKDIIETYKGNDFVNNIDSQTASIF